MPKLELIMSNKTTGDLAPDDVRALLSDHLEGSLDDDTRAAVDAALARDPQLAKERAALEQTVNLLRALPRSDAPDGLVGKVRDRLAQERREQQPSSDGDVPNNVVELAPRRRFGFEIVVGLAAAAAIAAVVVTGLPGLGRGNGGNGGVLTAGAGTVAAVSLNWRAPGIERATVVELAKNAGLAVQDDGSFAGDRQSAARFLIQLKTRAAGAGSDISGNVPEAAEAVVVVVTP